MQPRFTVNCYLVEGTSWHLRLNKDQRTEGGIVFGDFSSSMKADRGVISAPGSSFAHLRVEDISQAKSRFKIWHLTTEV